jgi:hypothetical protein
MKAHLPLSNHESTTWAFYDHAIAAIAIKVRNHKVTAVGGA